MPRLQEMKLPICPRLMRLILPEAAKPVNLNSIGRPPAATKLALRHRSRVKRQSVPLGVQGGKQLRREPRVKPSSHS